MASTLSDRAAKTGSTFAAWYSPYRGDWTNDQSRDIAQSRDQRIRDPNLQRSLLGRRAEHLKRQDGQRSNLGRDVVRRRSIAVPCGPGEDHDGSRDASSRVLDAPPPGVEQRAGQLLAPGLRARRAVVGLRRQRRADQAGHSSGRMQHANIRLSTQHLAREEAQYINVAGARRFALELLGSHITHAPGDRSGVRTRCRLGQLHAGETEVDQLHQLTAVAEPLQDDVLGLEIAVHDALVVRSLEGGSDLPENRGGARALQGAARRAPAATWSPRHIASRETAIRPAGCPCRARPPLRDDRCAPALRSRAAGGCPTSCSARTAPVSSRRPASTSASDRQAR